MKQTYTRAGQLGLGLAALCFVVGIARADAQTAPGTNGWGFVAGPESQRLFDRIRNGRRDLVASPLSPDTATEMVLPEVSMAVDANGRRIVGMKGQLGATAKDMFWVVDPTSGTYRVFTLDGTPADAQKIARFLREKAPGRPIPLERIQRHLEEARSRKAARHATLLDRMRGRQQQQAAISGPPPAIGSDPQDILRAQMQLASWKIPKGRVRDVAQYPVCSGGGEATIGHFDPIFIELTETYTWASWWFNGFGDYSVVAGGSCWANPETPVGTHWFQDACYGELSSNPTYAFAHTENISHNVDFLTSDYTWVDDQADVYQTSGSPGWATFTYDAGEAHELIFGLTLLGWASC